MEETLKGVPAGLGTCDEGICAGDAEREGVAGGDIDADENDMGLRAHLALRCDGTVDSFEVVDVACDVESLMDRLTGGFGFEARWDG